MTQLVKRRARTAAIGLIGVLAAAAPVFSLDIPKCNAGEYLWLVTAGNPTGTIMPPADMRVGTVTFQDWTDGSKTLRTARFTNVPKGILGAAKTFERYSGGGNLGWFAQSWPTALEGYDIENFKALPPRNPAPGSAGGEYPTDFASSRLIDGAPGQTLAQVLGSADFNGELTYVAPAEARVSFVTLALCTSALPKTPAPDAPPNLTPSAATPQDEQAKIAARIKALEDARESKRLEEERLEAERQERERAEEAERLETERLEAEQLETERLETARLENERLEAERLEAQRLETEQPQTTPPQPTTPQTTPPVYEKSELLRGPDIAAQTKRDMIMSGTIAGSAMLNVAANALVNLMRGAAAPAPVPAPSPAPVPTPPPSPLPSPSLASGGGTGRKKEKKGEEKKGAPPELKPEPIITPPTPNSPSAPQAKPRVASPSKSLASSNSDALSNLQTSEKGVLFPSSPSSTGPIPNAPAAVAAAYAAVGRVGYPHSPRAARDAGGIGFGSAVLIGPNKVLTNYHVWHIIKDKPGIGVEFEALEGNEVSEFITLDNMTPEILEGHDAVVLTLSRKLPRKPLWPAVLHYSDPGLKGRKVYAIGHPIKPEDESWLMKNAIEEVFGSPDPLWNVKRFSAGPLVGHKADIDGDILFDVPVRGAINRTGVTPALCHRASTIGGNSGGAIICAETGAFLGLHFGGQYWKDEDINYAVPGGALLSGLTALGIYENGAPISLSNEKDTHLFPQSPYSAGPLPNMAAPFKASYDAVGRVGRPHGYTGDDRLSFGSAVLIAPNKVLTNYHIWDHFLREHNGDVGVEFEARDGSSASEFIAFTEDEGVHLAGMDAVVMTLQEKSHRQPLWPEARETSGPNTMEGTDIYCLGYPVKPKDANAATRILIDDVFRGKPPKWHLKLWSAGKILRHSADEDSDIIFDVPVTNRINMMGDAAALLHNASTIGGNSGGAIICQDSGAFLGLHFGGGERAGETVNFAVPAERLINALLENGFSIPHETPGTITPNAAPDIQEPDPEPEPERGREPNTQTQTPTLTQHIIDSGNPHTVSEEPDDLTRIEGIGPKTAAALHKADIRSFRKLSQGSPYDLLPLLEQAGLPRRDPTTWPAQAALAADGDWDRLLAWQAQLHGGRES